MTRRTDDSNRLRAGTFTTAVFGGVVAGAILVAACGTEEEVCPNGIASVVHDRETITADTTWDADCNEHVIDGAVSVKDGATLTIARGATVRLREDARLVIRRSDDGTAGALVAQGDAEHPVHFVRDGETAWASISVEYPGTANLEHVVIEGGGSDDVEYGSASLVVRGDYQLPRKDIASLKNVTIRDSVGPGLWLRESGSLLAGSSGITVTGCGNINAIDRTAFPVVLQPTAATTFPTVTLSGNVFDELLLDTNDTSEGTPDIVEDVTLHDRGVPYRVGHLPTSRLRFGTDGQHPNVTLTIEPGVTLRFPKSDGNDLAAGIELNHFTESDGGALPGTTIQALGTAEKPIVFTSASDAPAAGDWAGLWFGGGANANNALDHVIIDYAGGESLAGGFVCPEDHSNNGAIAIMGGPAATAFLTNSIVRNSASAGVVKGWNADQGPDVDFTPTNTFEAIGECTQTILRDANNGCPNTACQ